MDPKDVAGILGGCIVAAILIYVLLEVIKALYL